MKNDTGSTVSGTVKMTRLCSVAIEKWLCNMVQHCNMVQYCNMVLALVIGHQCNRICIVGIWSIQLLHTHKSTGKPRANRAQYCSRDFNSATHRRHTAVLILIEQKNNTTRAPNRESNTTWKARIREHTLGVRVTPAEPLPPLRPHFIHT